MCTPGVHQDKSPCKWGSIECSSPFIRNRSVEIPQRVTSAVLGMTKECSDVPPYSTEALPAPGTANFVAVDTAVLDV